MQLETSSATVFTETLNFNIKGINSGLRFCLNNVFLLLSRNHCERLTF